MFPQAELFTSVYDPSPWPAQITERTVHSSFLSRIPGAARHYPKLLPLMNRAFRSFDLSTASTSCSRAATRAPRTCARRRARCTCATATRRCATPGRRASSTARRSGARCGWRCRRCWRGCAARTSRARPVPTCSSPTPGTWPSASSATTGARPRSSTRRWTSSTSSASSASARASYYLAFGRVVPYKRVDLAVAACARLGRPLKVAGDGRALDAVRAAGGPGRRRVPRQGLRGRARPAAGRRARAAVPGRGGLRDRARRGAGGRACR